MKTFADVQEAARFFGYVLHDLHPPIDAIQAIADRAQRHEKKGRAPRNWIEDVAVAAELAERRIFNANFVICRTLGGPLHVRSEHIGSREAQQFLGAVARQGRMIAKSRDIRIEAQVDSIVLPEGTRLRFDRSLIRQALGNIVENAVEYSYHGTTVSIRCGIDGRDFAISVQNQGILMSAEDIDRCTEFLWRGGRASQVHSGGLGVGLWVVDAVVQAHEAQMRITSVEDVTTFEIGFGLSRAGGNPT